MRNIPPNFPACMFIPIIASCRPSCRLSPKHCRNLDQNPCRNRATDRGSRSNSSYRSDGRTYEISLLGSCSRLLSPPPPPDRVQHLPLFLRARELGSDQESQGKTRFIATGGSYPWFIQSRIASVRRSGADLISRATPTRKLGGGGGEDGFHLQLMARSRIWSISILLF